MWWQNIIVTIPEPPELDGRLNQEELTLKNVIEVHIHYAKEATKGKWGQYWHFCYALMVHSNQGLTIHDPQKVWIIDEYLFIACRWPFYPCHVRGAVSDHTTPLA